MKVSDSEFVKALENRKPNQSDADLARQLGISPASFCVRVGKFKDRTREAVKNYINSQALLFADKLVECAKDNDMQAIKLGMEITGDYIPISKQQVDFKDTTGIIYTEAKVPVDAEKIKADHKAKMKLVNSKTG